MENPRNNPNFSGDGGQSIDLIRTHIEDPFPSISEINRLGVIPTAAQTEPMRQPQLGQLKSADLSFSKSQTILEAEQGRRLRRREADRKYRAMKRQSVEKRQEEMDLTIHALEAENVRLKNEKELLKRENALVREAFEILSQELDKLKEELKEQCVNEQQMKSNLTMLEDENEFLKKEIAFLEKEHAKSMKSEKMRTGNPSKENSKPITTFSGSSEDVGKKHSVGGSSASIGRHLQNQDLSIGAQNLPKINQIATEAEPVRQQQAGQSQPAELSANSQSSRDITEITSAKLRVRKSAVHRAYRESLKKRKLMEYNLKTLQSEMVLQKKFETRCVELATLKNRYEKMRTRSNSLMEDSKPITSFKAENGLLRSTKELLKQEYDFLNQKFEIQSKELDELRKNFDILKKNHEEQQERNQQLEYEIRTRDAKIHSLNDRYIAVLEKYRYATETPVGESAQKPVTRTNSPRTSDCGSGIGA